MCVHAVLSKEFDCVVLALCRHATGKPWLSSVGSHHAADAAAVGSLYVRAILGFAADTDFACHRYAVSVHTMLRHA